MVMDRAVRPVGARAVARRGINQGGEITVVIKHIIGLFTDPVREWKRLHDEECTVGKCFATHTLFLAAIPPVAGFIGTTQFGWQIGATEPVKLSVESAATIAVLYYFALLVAVLSVGALIKWMGDTYGANATMPRAIVLASYTATPLFLIGIFQLYPVLWLNMVLGLPALAYSVYLLYSGLPIMMEVPPERGFLYASAVLAVGLVVLVASLAVTVILWGHGFEPQFERIVG